MLSSLQASAAPVSCTSDYQSLRSASPPSRSSSAPAYSCSMQCSSMTRLPFHPLPLCPDTSLPGRAGREELVRCLLGSAAKSNVGDANSRGLTPLGEAIAGSHIPCAELLIAQVQRPGSDLQDKTKNYTCLGKPG